ncbi:hypothetical protein D3C81_1151660 [compost metagenome]
MVIARLAENQLVAGGVQRIGQRLHGRQELLHGDVRHQRGHHQALAGLQPAGQQVRDVAGHRHGLAHAGDGCLGHHARIAQRARGGNQRDAGLAGDIMERDGLGCRGLGHAGSGGFWRV